MPVGVVRQHRVGSRAQIVLATLNRPDRANAYTQAILQTLADVLEQARIDRSIGALVVAAEGKSFCAGADRSELSTRAAEDALTLLSRDVFDRLASSRLPTIAAIDGPAVGGGFELALACDLRICGPSASFWLPELAHALLPAAGGVRRLLEELSVARAKELVLFGRRLAAEEALAWGVVTRVASDPLAAAIAAAEAASEADPLAFNVTKLLIDDRAGVSSGVSLEAVTQALLYERRRKVEAP